MRGLWRLGAKLRDQPGFVCQCSEDKLSPYTQQYNLTIQRELWNGWAVEAGYVGTRYIGGLGIWDPHLANLASPSSPINVTDINGVSYSITANTVNNEELRHQVIGLSRKRGELATPTTSVREPIIQGSSRCREGFNVASTSGQPIRGLRPLTMLVVR